MSNIYFLFQDMQEVNKKIRRQKKHFASPQISLRNYCVLRSCFGQQTEHELGKKIIIMRWKNTAVIAQRDFCVILVQVHRKADADTGIYS